MPIIAYRWARSPSSTLHPIDNIAVGTDGVTELPEAAMKALYVLKVGTTFPATAAHLGDFDRWTTAALGKGAVETSVLDVEHGADLPAVSTCAGVVITGSHAMVTDELPWSIAIEQWLPSLLDARIPIFGICYGHQLLARAAGGRVDFHPRGKEIGTVGVDLLPECIDDELFHSLPRTFIAHTTHSQSVLRLPPGAVHLAGNDFEPNHAYRLGECAWGVQFHPEYDEAVMRSYIVEQSESLTAAGMNVEQLLRQVRETPAAARTMKNFARIVETRLTHASPAEC